MILDEELWISAWLSVCIIYFKTIINTLFDVLS